MATLSTHVVDCNHLIDEDDELAILALTGHKEMMANLTREHK
jgi:hypothetical protein